jgi:hypothetical protein
MLDSSLLVGKFYRWETLKSFSRSRGCVVRLAVPDSNGVPGEDAQASSTVAPPSEEPTKDPAKKKPGRNARRRKAKQKAALLALKEKQKANGDSQGTGDGEGDDPPTPSTDTAVNSGIDLIKHVLLTTPQDPLDNYRGLPYPTIIFDPSKYRSHGFVGSQSHFEFAAWLDRYVVPFPLTTQRVNGARLNVSTLISYCNFTDDLISFFTICCNMLHIGKLVDDGNPYLGDVLFTGYLQQLARGFSVKSMNFERYVKQLGDTIQRNLNLTFPDMVLENVEAFKPKLINEGQAPTLIFPTMLLPFHKMMLNPYFSMDEWKELKDEDFDVISFPDDPRLYVDENGDELTDNVPEKLIMFYIKLIVELTNADGEFFRITGVFNSATIDMFPEIKDLVTDFGTWDEADALAYNNGPIFAFSKPKIRSRTYLHNDNKKLTEQVSAVKNVVYDKYGLTLPPFINGIDVTDQFDNSDTLLRKYDTFMLRGVRKDMTAFTGAQFAKVGIPCNVTRMPDFGVGRSYLDNEVSELANDYQALEVGRFARVNGVSGLQSAIVMARDWPSTNDSVIGLLPLDMASKMNQLIGRLQFPHSTQGVGLDISDTTATLNVVSVYLTSQLGGVTVPFNLGNAIREFLDNVKDVVLFNEQIDKIFKQRASSLDRVSPQTSRMFDMNEFADR